MTVSRFLAFVLAVTFPCGVGSAQQAPDAPPTPAGQAAVVFFDADGEVSYRVPRSAALDADGLQQALWIARLYERFDARAESDDSAAAARSSMRARWSGLGGTGAAPAAGLDVAAQVAPSARALSGRFEIDGDFSAALASGTFVMFQRVPAKKASGGATMGAATMGAATTSASAAGPVAAVPGEIARAELVDGRFTLEGEVDHVHPVYFYVMDARTPDGRRMAPTKGQGFLLEPGRLQVTMNEGHQHTVTGGYFNAEVVGAWKNSPAYQDLQALMPLAFRRLNGETDAERESFRDLGMTIQSALLDAETEGRKSVALGHADPLVRQLVIETAWLGGPWMLKGAREVLALDPENAWARDYVARAAARTAGSGGAAQAGDVGSRYLPFAASSLGGDRVSLSATCANNRYVLLEFWASWCGPCRAEIPHLKAAYERYRDRGFEIFGYTLDDDRSKWATASEQEALPWIDSGWGAKSDPVLLYGVSGVPANYLIDGATGMVVARNLRGEALTEKLESLFDKR